MTKLRLHTAPLVLALTAILPALADEPLPHDTRIQTGKLDNGVTWMYRQHSVPPQKMALMLHIRCGSLCESDDERGLAHFLEHMAFNGSEHFAAGQLVKYFESIGMEFGRDLNAVTGFDQTLYWLFLPDTTPEQVDKALMVLGDYAFRLTLPQEQMDRERDVVLAEQRAGMSAEQRLRDQLFAKLFAGTRLGQRLPIGLEPVIQSVKRPELEKFYRTWYQPDRMTVLMVGDAEPTAYIPLIAKWFGTYRSAVLEQPLPGPELKPFTQERAIVLSDPEYAEGDVDLYNLLPGRPPTTTVEQARVDMVERIGSWIMGRRFSERIRQAEASYREAGAQVSNFFNDALLADASALGEPKDWELMLGQLTGELTRAAAHGFLARELELCNKTQLAGAEDAARKELTRDARDLLSAMSDAVHAREPILSAEQYLELLKKLLPSIQLEEINRRFAANFKPGTFAFVLTLPKKAEVALPAEEQVLAAARAALARQAEPPPAQSRPTTLLEKAPEPGKLTGLETDDELAITSGWFENGARVHHRFMDYKKDTVLVSLTLAGGQIEETAENAGITTAADLVLAQPATNRLTSTDIQDIMTGKNITIRSNAQDDAFTLTLSGSPLDLEAGLQLVYALLTDGKLERSAFDNWKKAALEQYETASKMPEYVALDTLLRTVSGDDPRRIVLLPPKLIEAQALDRAQAWYQRLCREAPLEVAVVGEITLEQVQPLLEKYVGSLPKRPRTAGSFDKLRVLKRPPGPLTASVEVPTITPQAMAVIGFMGCDATAMGDVRALNMAANILDSRLVRRVREELGLVYAIQAVNGPARTYADAGLFFSGAPCAPDKVNDVFREVGAIFQTFADQGPTPEEMDNGKKQIRNRLDTQLKDPEYWFGQLATLDLHKTQLADLKRIPEAYDALTAEQVQSVFKKYDVPGRAFSVTALPAKSPATSQPTR